MVEGIAFYALYKSRVLIIPCKANDSCLFIGLPDEIYKKAPGIGYYTIWKFIFSLFCGVTLRKHYIITCIVKRKFFGYKNKCSKNEIEKFAVWQHFLISGKHKCPSQIKNYI